MAYLLRRILGCIALLLPLGALAQTGNGSRIEFGFEQRVRNENWSNIIDFNDQLADDRNQIRYRTRVWTQVPLNHDIDVYVGLNQETNQIVVPRSPYRFNEVVFEHAYVDFKKLFVKGLSLRVGRQNIMKGEGFLLLEGNPGDGSRTIYFNAADLAYTYKKSKFELIAISNPRQDRYFPRFNDYSRQLVERDEQAIGAYYTDANLKKSAIEAYYFYKKEVRDPRPSSNPQFQPDRHLHTAGGRIVQQIAKGWSATGEFAVQAGQQHPRTDVAGWGGYGYLRRNFTHPWKPYALFGYWGFSGDDPATKDKVEGWDPLFARWPKWSELYLYSLVREVGVAYWTNLGMWQAEAGFSPWKPAALRFTYYHMDSFHPFPGDKRIFGTGTRRGEMVQGRLDFTATKDVKGHVLYEYISPGAFYSAKTPGYFLRFEIIYTLRGYLPL